MARIKRLDISTIKRSAVKRGAVSADQWNDTIDELVADWTGISTQWNGSLVVAMSGLPYGVPDATVDAFKFGLDGRHFYIDSSATGAGASARYFNTNKNRPFTAKEITENMYSILDYLLELIPDSLQAAGVISIDLNDGNGPQVGAVSVPKPVTSIKPPAGTPIVGDVILAGGGTAVVSQLGQTITITTPALASAEDVVTTITNNDTALQMGEIVTIVGESSTEREWASNTTSPKAIGVVKDATIANAATGDIAIGGRAAVFVRGGLTLTPGDILYLEPSDGSPELHATNVLYPGTWVIPIGTLIDTNGYAGTEGLVYVALDNRSAAQLYYEVSNKYVTDDGAFLTQEIPVPIAADNSVLLEVTATFLDDNVGSTQAGAFKRTALFRKESGGDLYQVGATINHYSITDDVTYDVLVARVPNAVGGVPTITLVGNSDDIAQWTVVIRVQGVNASGIFA